MRLQTQFKKEESNRSLNPSLETLLMRRYGASNINVNFLDRVVMKGRRALGMTVDEDWTEALETWCHGYLQAQLQDPAFLAAQQLRQMKASLQSNEKAVSSSSHSKKGVGKKKHQGSSKAAQQVEEKIKAIRRKTPRVPTVDDVLEARRENSLRNLLVKEESTSSLLSMPKKPERKESNPKRRVNNAIPGQKQARKKNLSPSEFLVRRNIAQKPLPALEAVAVLPKIGRKEPFPKEPHPNKETRAKKKKDTKINEMESFTERTQVTKQEKASILCTMVKVPCKHPEKEGKVVDDPLGKASNHTQNSDSSMSLTMPQRQKSPIKKMLRNKEKSVASEYATDGNYSNHTRESIVSKASSTQQMNLSLTSCISGTRICSVDLAPSADNGSNCLTETLAAVNQALNEKKKKKFTWSLSATTPKFNFSDPRQPSLRGAIGDVALQNTSICARPGEIWMAPDDNESNASSVSFGSHLLRKEDLSHKSSLDRWNAHSANDQLAETKQRSSSSRPFRCRTIPLYLQGRQDFTPKRPSRNTSEASRSLQ